MEITIISYVLALLMGVVLGLIGGGGSILTVPILVYLLHINPVTATAYSLFIVGSTALAGAIRNIPKRNLDVITGVVFAIPALIAVYSTRKFIIPAIPDSLFSIGSLEITKDIAIMIFFAIIMLMASISMIRDNNKKTPEPELGAKVKYNYPMILIEGVVVGVITGLVGAGGGFLIIPALVLFAKLPMKKAVATSLFIIAIKSLFGFIGDVQNIPIDWSFLLIFTGFSIVGIMLGVYINKFIDGDKLKKVFGYFVLVMGIYIIIKELM
jgi:uncharacterized membrane protein YfcA